MLRLGLAPPPICRPHDSCARINQRVRKAGIPRGVFCLLRLSRHHCNARRHSASTSIPGKLVAYSATLAGVSAQVFDFPPTVGNTSAAPDGSEPFGGSEQLAALAARSISGEGEGEGEGELALRSTRVERLFAFERLASPDFTPAFRRLLRNLRDSLYNWYSFFCVNLPTSFGCAQKHARTRVEHMFQSGPVLDKTANNASSSGKEQFSPLQQ